MSLRCYVEPAQGLGLLAVLLWSTVATAFKLALQQLTPLQLQWLAVMTSAVVLCGGLLVTGQGSLLWQGVRYHWRRHCLLALLNPISYYLVLFAAYDRLPAQLAQPINYTWAITLALLAIPVRGHRLNRGQVGALIVGYCGVVVIALQGQWNGFAGTDLGGVGLALFSTVLWAVFCLANSGQQQHPVVDVGVQFLLAAGVLTVAVWLWGRPMQWGSTGIWAGIYVGLFEMGFTFVLWLSALKRTRNTARISQLIFLSPFISLVLIHFILHESIHTSTILGLLLILSGVMVQQRVGNKV